MGFAGLAIGLTAVLSPACVQAAPHRAEAAPTAAPLDPARMLLALRPSIAAAEAVEAAAPAVSAPAQAAEAPLAPTPARLLEPAVQPYRLTATATGRRNEVECLAAAVHYEAANQGEEGQEAVAQVVLNRLNDPRYPKTVCGVVFQGSTRSTGCQFTFTCDGSLSRRPAMAAWRRAETVAEQALDGYVMTDVGAATHYHTIWVHPYWGPTLVKVARIGAHVFYRVPGAHAPGASPVLTRASLARAPRASRAAAAAPHGFTAWGLSVTGPERPITTTAW
jgi:spore germination cell wall hydrolase CwlJ-like protein